LIFFSYDYFLGRGDVVNLPLLEKLKLCQEFEKEWRTCQKFENFVVLFGLLPYPASICGSEQQSSLLHSTLDIFLELVNDEQFTVDITFNGLVYLEKLLFVKGHQVVDNNLLNWLLVFFRSYNDSFAKEKIALILSNFYSLSVPECTFPKKMEAILPVLMNFNPSQWIFEAFANMGKDRNIKDLKINALFNLAHNDANRNMLIDNDLVAVLLRDETHLSCLVKLSLTLSLPHRRRIANTPGLITRAFEGFSSFRPFANRDEEVFLYARSTTESQLAEVLGNCCAWPG
jgi:hypothetical protein